MSTIKYDLNDTNPLRMHLQCRRGDVGEYVIVPGDPFRCDWIASFLEEPKLISHNREIKIYTGKYKGLTVSCCSTGMGCPSTSIVCEELVDVGAKVLLRTGSGFLLRDDIGEGDVAVTIGSAKYEGTTKFFVPKGYPAIAEHDLVTCLVKTARRYVEVEDLGYKVHTGITATVDGFYGETPEFLDKLKKLNIMNIEMESAAVIITAMRHGVRGGCICTCGRDDTSEKAKEIYKLSMERQLMIALDSFVMLDEMIRNGECINK